MKTLIICIVLVLPVQLHAQRTVDFIQNINIKSDLLEYTRLLPDSKTGRQKLIDVQLSVDPDELVHSQNEYHIKYGKKKLRKHQNIRITSSMILYRNDLFTAKKRGKPLEPATNLDEYLQAEEYLEINSKPIKNTAKKLKGKDREASVRNIFDFVVNHLDFLMFRNQRRGALKAFKQKKGDCTEYSELMIALCRAIGIPARYVNGLIANDGLENPHHNWVEVYFEKYGWVAFDPTYADNSNGFTTFDKMVNVYIYVSYKRDHWYNNWRTLHKSNPDIHIDFQVKDQLHDKLDTILLNINQKKYTPAKKQIDSLLESGISDHHLFVNRAKIHLKTEQLDLVLADLQGALKNCYFEKGKGSIHHLFYRYYLKLGNTDFAVKHLNKAFDLGHSMRYKEMISFLKEDRYASIRDHEKLKAHKKLLEKKYRELFLKSEHFYHLDDELALIKPGCQQKLSTNWNSNLEELTPSLIQKNKVKLVKVNGIGLKQNFYFSKQGQLTHSVSNLKHSVTNQSIKYDRLGRKKEVLYLQIKNAIDTTIWKQFFTYDDYCLTEITECNDDCDQKEALVIYSARGVGTNNISIDFYDRFRKTNIQRHYNFDDQGKINSCLIIENQDTARLHWAYDDTKNTMTKYIDDEQVSFSELNKHGLPTKMIKEKIQMKKKYDRQKRLVKETIQYGSQYTSLIRYEFNKNGLIKSKDGADEEKHWNPMLSYEYEYY